MASRGSERRLSAVMFSDIVGYTALMGESETRGLRARDRHRRLVRDAVRRFGGKLVDETGDELLCTLPSAVDGANCALQVQDETSGDADTRLRIGIHVGDVLFDGGRIYGDGVNVASRIRPLAEPGGICVSGDVEHLIRNQSNLEIAPLGERSLKSVERPVSLFAVSGTPARPEARRSARGRWIALGAALLAGAVAVALAIPPHLDIPEYEPASLPGARETAILVLPFDDMSPEQDKEYFSDGLTEEIIHTLARIDGLQVVSRTSAFSFEGRSRDVRTIGAELDVGSVLEGSVRQAGERLRVTAQLINASSGYHRWSESYDRLATDVFAVQEEIAHAIATALEVSLASTVAARSAGARTSNFQAYDLTLRGKAELRQRSRAAVERARDHFESAIAIDPEYAPGSPQRASWQAGSNAMPATSSGTSPWRWRSGPSISMPRAPMRIGRWRPRTTVPAAGSDTVPMRSISEPSSSRRETRTCSRAMPDPSERWGVASRRWPSSSARSSSIPGRRS